MMQQNGMCECRGGGGGQLLPLQKRVVEKVLVILKA